jgi:uncharacterized protein (DUF2225 family)
MTQQSEFVCPVCGARFQSRELLEQHRIQDHQPPKALQ